MLVRQLEEEVVKTRQHAKETNPEIKAHIEGLQLENDHLTREVAILKETIKVSPHLLLLYLCSTNPQGYRVTRYDFNCINSDSDSVCI